MVFNNRCRLVSNEKAPLEVYSSFLDKKKKKKRHEEYILTNGEVL